MPCFLFLFCIWVSLLVLSYACNAFLLLPGRQKLTHSHYCQWNSTTTVKPQVFSSFFIQPLLLLWWQHQLYYSNACLSTQKILRAKLAEYLVINAACHGYMSSCSFCNIKHGKYMVMIWLYENWRNWCNHGLWSQYPQLIPTLSGHVRFSLSFYGLVRFVRFPVTGVAFRACLSRKWVSSMLEFTAVSVGTLRFIWHSSVILEWVSC